MSGNVANDPTLVDKLVKIFARAPSSDLIRNLDATVETYALNGTSFPLSHSTGRNCYICSPTVAYIDYALEEMRNFADRPMLRKTLLALIRACRPLIRATGLDRQVQPNNWLFSTNPVPALTEDDARQMRDDLTAAHPGRAIVLRSVNTRADADTIRALKAAGFQMLPARQIYIFDGETKQKPSADMKRDRKLLAETDYEIVPAHNFSASDFTRAAMLYSLLYLDKYTNLNPQYTPGYLAQAHQIGLLKIIGLRGPDEQLDGVIGLFENGKTLTVPIIGYDTGRPQELGLYRLLNALGQAHAIEHGKFYNMSAGAAAFKRHRRAEPAIEYTAVYVRHLGWHRRIATTVVKLLLDWIGIPLLKRFEL